MISSNKFKKIIFIIFISLIIGLVHIYTDLKFIYKLGSDFKGIVFNAPHDATLYLGRVNYVYKNDNKIISAVDLYEHKQDPWILPFLGELFLGTIGSSLHIPLNYFKILMSFSLPIINFWLIYYFTFLLSNSKSASIVSAFAVTLGYSLFAGNPIYIYELLFKKESAIHLYFLRPISPQFNYMLLLTSWIVLYFFVIYQTYLYSMLSGLLIGLFFYIGGIYYFTYFFVFIGLYIFFTVIKKDYPQLIKIAVMLILIVILAIPYAVNHSKLLPLSGYKHLMERCSFIYGHNPIIPIGITIVSTFIGWFHYSRNTMQAKFIILFILSGFICLNQQLITGKTLEPAHWQNYMIKTFTIVILFSTIGLVLKDNKYLYPKKNILKYIAMAVFIVLAMIQQENYYNRFENRFEMMQILAKPFSWLKENTNKEDVILNDPMNFQMEIFPYQQDFLMYSNNYTYLPASFSTLVSKEENEHRFLAALRFYDYNLKEAESFFTYWNGIYFRGMNAEISYGGSKMPDDYLYYLKSKYTEFIKENPIRLLSKYKVDYVISHKLNPLYSKIDDIYKTIQKVYDDGQFKIYKISEVS